MSLDPDPFRRMWRESREGRRWTRLEIAILRTLGNNGVGNADIARLLGRSRESIRCMRWQVCDRRRRPRDPQAAARRRGRG